MAGKSRNRIPLESAMYLSIDCLHLARMPAGWHRRGKAIRELKVHHQRWGHIVAETRLSAEIQETAGVVSLKHHGVDGWPIAQTLDLEPVPQPFGGQRWFFVCPVTGMRARKLY